MVIIFALVVNDAVAVLLLVAGVTKAASNRQFREAVADYELLPNPLVPVVARAVPMIEILIGGLMVAALARPIGLVGGASVLTLFAAAMAVNLVRGRRNDCGCTAGRQVHPISWRLVLRNVSLAGLVVISGVITTGSLRPFMNARLPALVIAAALVMAVSACRASSAIWRHPALSVEPAAVLP